ncbi:class I SAM-dependent methyltransferase [Streptomyces sp. DSM 41014]|uniref:S-adenosyl-L-methionine-dependent methyltransferase n=2 Tax=Streptomyces TaxID=1883 RepID=A0ABU2UCD4_9ACTN|nr:class I SAM-dependent methyltransferase [Streptomyces sp. DSM 41014]MDT0470671.1 class I SAM-dependent methyltransferase [Streptomyces sp. DSM 41014]
MTAQGEHRAAESPLTGRGEHLAVELPLTGRGEQGAVELPLTARGEHRPAASPLIVQAEQPLVDLSLTGQAEHPTAKTPLTAQGERTPAEPSLTALERTALLTAALRAAETSRPDRLYTDPYAAGLAGEAGWALLAEVAAAGRRRTAGRDVPSTPDFNAIRTRFLDDHLRRLTHEQGIRQVVSAPAGLDTRAWRLRWPDGTRWFEIDRPALLDHKRRRLAEATPRADLRTVAADLTGPDWEQSLRASGYDPTRPSVWVLEGLLYYLSEDAVRRLLTRIAACSAPGSEIAADLVNTAALTLPDMRPLLAVFEEWGTPWVSGSDEPEHLFDTCGYTVTARQPGDEEADFGRWPDPVVPREVPGARRVFFVHGSLRAPR